MSLSTKVRDIMSKAKKPTLPPMWTIYLLWEDIKLGVALRKEARKAIKILNRA